MGEDAGGHSPIFNGHEDVVERNHRRGMGLRAVWGHEEQAMLRHVRAKVSAVGGCAVQVRDRESLIARDESGMCTLPAVLRGYRVTVVTEPTELTVASVQVGR